MLRFEVWILVEAMKLSVETRVSIKIAVLRYNFPCKIRSLVCLCKGNLDWSIPLDLEAFWNNIPFNTLYSNKNLQSWDFIQIPWLWRRGFRNPSVGPAILKPFPWRISSKKAIARIPSFFYSHSLHPTSVHHRCILRPFATIATCCHHHHLQPPKLHHIHISHSPLF